MAEIYDAYIANRENAEKGENTEKVSFRLGDTDYRIILTKRRANKYSVIHCKGSDVIWEQHPMVPRLTGRLYDGEVEFIEHFSEDRGYVTVFVVKGKPNSITGLDEGIFASFAKFDKHRINVMSESRFKEL